MSDLTYKTLDLFKWAAVAQESLRAVGDPPGDLLLDSIKGIVYVFFAYMMSKYR